MPNPLLGSCCVYLFLSVLSIAQAAGSIHPLSRQASGGSETESSLASLSLRGEAAAAGVELRSASCQPRPPGDNSHSQCPSPQLAQKYSPPSELPAQGVLSSLGFADHFHFCYLLHTYCVPGPEPGPGCVRAAWDTAHSLTERDGGGHRAVCPGW